MHHNNVSNDNQTKLTPQAMGYDDIIIYRLFQILYCCHLQRYCGAENAL